MPSANAKVLKDCLIVMDNTAEDFFGEHNEWNTNPLHVFLREGWVLEINDVPRREEYKDSTDFYYRDPESDEGGYSPESFKFEDFEELAKLGYIELSDVTGDN
jgi:hypothetical protein